jgi:hypothetical protein
MHVYALKKKICIMFYALKKSKIKIIMHHIITKFKIMHQIFLKKTQALEIFDTIKKRIH